MNQKDKIQGVALRCSLQGKIRSVLQDNLGPHSTFHAGKIFADELHKDSFSKALNFLAEIQKKDIVFDWEFHTRAGKPTDRLSLSGTIVGDDLYLIGAKNRADLLQLIEKKVPGGRERLEKIFPGMVISEKEPFWDAPTTQDDATYDRLTELYNEMANLQRQLSKKNIELERLSNQKDHFLGMAAHELRHPLGIIQLLTGLLKEEAGSQLSQEQTEYITMISTYSESMLKMVDDFLDLAIIESGRWHLDKKSTNLVEIFQKNLALNRLAAKKKRIDLEFIHDDRMPVVMVDSTQIEQVLNNLISNALKFSPEGSRIEVYLRHTRDEIIFEVKDQGSGIPPELLPKLFEPFEKSDYPQDESQQGLGLGLAIARKIVEAHEGRIWVASEINKGSIFRVFLPIQTNFA